jgi:hypothetical protein
MYVKVMSTEVSVFLRLAIPTHPHMSTSSYGTFRLYKPNYRKGTLVRGMVMEKEFLIHVTAEFLTHEHI